MNTPRLVPIIAGLVAIVLSWVPLSAGAQWGTNGSAVYYNAGNVGVGTDSPAAKLEISNGSVRLPSAGTGIEFITDSAGIFQFVSVVDGIVHYVPDAPATPIPTDGIRFDIGGKTWAYLLNTQKSTGSSAAQLYFSNYEGGGNRWFAPIHFDNVSNNGANRAIAISLTDTSSGVPLNVTGLEVNIDSPTDRGGDSSGIYVRQLGGGNGISAYKDAPHAGMAPTGSAIEVKGFGTSNAIVSITDDGHAYLAAVDGQGAGVTIMPTNDNAGTNRRAMQVVNATNTAEKFFVTMGGAVYAAGNAAIAGGTNHAAELDVNGFIETVDAVPFSVKRFSGPACTLDGAGAIWLLHGIPAGHQKVLQAAGYWKGPSGEMYSLPLVYIDGDRMAFNGGPNAAARRCRITLIYSNSPDAW